jgi:hypothetical protein
MASLSPASATKVLGKHSAASHLFAFDFGPQLASGETLSSVSCAAVSGLTFGTPAVQGTEFTDEFTGATIAANEGCKMRISGGTAGTDYTLTMVGSTSAGNTIPLVCTLQVRDT